MRTNGDAGSPLLRGPQLCRTAGVAIVAVVALGTLGVSIAGAYSGLGTGRGFCARAARGGYPLSGQSSPFHGPPRIDNVYACGPLPIGSSPFDWGPPIAKFWPSGGRYGPAGGFQCTEYAARYLYKATNGGLLDFNVLSGEVFARLAAKTFHLKLGTSAKHELPARGDIISEAYSQGDPDANVGDVAVVAKVDRRNHEIWIFGENDTSSGYNVIRYSGTNWIINAGTSFAYTYFEWVNPAQHAKHQPSPPPLKPGQMKVIDPPLLTLKGTTPSSQGSGDYWNLTSDFLADPGHNPPRDHFGRDGVWSFMQSDSLAVDGHYSLLSNQVRNFEGSTNTEGWTGSEPNGCGSFSLNLPLAAVNSAAVSTTGCSSWTIPPYTVDLHPGASHMAIVAWKSPITGVVTLNGGVASIDPFGGGGIVYYIATSSGVLVRGSIPDGGAAVFPPRRIHVDAGELLYVIIAPPLSGLRNNSTALRLVISPGFVWAASVLYRVYGRPAGHPLLMRSGPGERYPVLGALPNGYRTQILCQAKGSLVAGRSAIWDQIRVGHWVSDYYLDTTGVGTFSPAVTTCP